MKRFIVICLCVLFLCPSIPVFAENTAVPAITVSSAAVKHAETVEIDVCLQNNPGICNFALDIIYDDNKLLFNGVTVNEDFSSDIIEGEDGYILWYDMTDSDYNGVVFTLNFTVLDTAESGHTEVTVSYDNETGGICNMQEENIEFTIQSGIINIFDGVIGDVDRDGVVNVFDLACIRNYLMDDTSIDDEESWICDIAVNENVDAVDLVRLKKIIAGINAVLG